MNRWEIFLNILSLIRERFRDNMSILHQIQFNKLPGLESGRHPPQEAKSSIKIDPKIRFPQKASPKSKKSTTLAIVSLKMESIST